MWKSRIFWSSFVLSLSLSSHVLADSVKIGERDWYYTLETVAGKSTPEVTIWEVDPWNGNVVVPSEINGYPVTTLGVGAFEFADGLNSIQLPETLRLIDEGAFYCCDDLTQITIGAAVTNVGMEAFRECSRLKSVKILSAQGEIGRYCFENCTNLTQVVMAEGVTAIQEAAFRGCSALEGSGFTIPSTVTQIGPEAFEGTQFMESIGESRIVEKDGCALVWKGPGLPRSTMSLNRYRLVADYAFYKDGGYPIQKLIIGGGLQYIGEGAFAECHDLVSISSDEPGMTIPSHVKSIGKEAFVECGLTNVVIAEGVESIGDGAFSNCSKLSAVSLPSSLTEVGQNIFDGCSSALQVELPPTMEVYPAFYAGNKGLKEVVIPKTIRAIAPQAFAGCTALTNVIFEAPSSVTNIGASAFEGCINLTVFDLPESVQCVGDFAYANTSLEKIKLRSDMVLGKNVFANVFGTTEVENWRSGIGLEGLYSLEKVTIDPHELEISTGAFYRSKLVEIVIPASVQEIKTEAFYSCEELRTVTFEDYSSLQTIGTRAFYGDLRLKRIDLPAKVIEIGESAFEECTDLFAVTLADEYLEKVGKKAFRNCYALETFTFPKSLKWIGEYAFENDRVLHEIALSDDVELRPDAFLGCGENVTKIEGWRPGIGLTNLRQLQFVTFASGITEIEHNAFEASQLIEVTIPASVVNIDDYAFRDSKLLEKVTIEGENLLRIGAEAFRDCTALSIINIPQSLKQLGRMAFAGTAIKTIDLPADVEIGDRPFDGCTAVESIENWRPELGIDSLSNIKHVSLANSVTDIPAGLFAHSTIEKIVLPAGVTNIGAQAFYDCANLRTIVFLGDQVETIGDEAFSLCTALSDFDYPLNLVSIGVRAFAGSGLKKLVLPYGVAWGECVFENCDAAETAVDWCPEMGVFSAENLKDLTFADTVTTIPDMAFENSQIRDLVIPASVTEIGARAFKASSQLARVYFEEGSLLTTIGDEAFADCVLLEEINLPANLKRIGNDAFKGCELLKLYEAWQPAFGPVPRDIERVIVAPGVTEIPDESFADCEKLEMIQLPEGITNIGARAFMNCRSLTSIVIPRTVEALGDEAFVNCRSLERVICEESAQLASLGNALFRECRLLKSFNMPSTVTNLPWHAFETCTSLVEMVISPRVTTIAEDAFEYCEALESVTIPSSVSVIEKDAFYDCKRLQTIYVSRGDTARIKALVDASQNMRPFLSSSVRYVEKDLDEPIPEKGTARNPWEVGVDSSSYVTAYIKDGTLHVQGQGRMQDFPSPAQAPWASRSADIQAVELVPTVRLGMNAFSSLMPSTSLNLGTVGQLPPSLISGGNLKAQPSILVVDSATKTATMAVTIQGSETLESPSSRPLLMGARASTSSWQPVRIQSGELSNDQKTLYLTIPATGKSGFYYLDSREGRE